MLRSMRPNLKTIFCLWLTLALGIAWAGPQLSPELSPAEKALGEAVRAGDLAGAQAALDQGADPNATYSTSPLIVAAAGGNAEMVRLLLQRGADPNLDSEQGSPVLFRAAQYGHSEVVSLLLEAGADPNATARGKTPLMAGAQNPEIVRKLLVAGADPDLSDSASTSGANVLHYAVGSPESLRILLNETGPGGAIGWHRPTYNVDGESIAPVDQGLYQGVAGGAAFGCCLGRRLSLHSAPTRGR
jgi:ankyrin repeat protein